MFRKIKELRLRWKLQRKIKSVTKDSQVVLTKDDMLKMYDQGYAHGFTKGHDVGYTKGRNDGITVAKNAAKQKLKELSSWQEKQKNQPSMSGQDMSHLT